MNLLGSCRIFTSHYQLMITDSMSREITDEMNWDEAKTMRGYAGDSNTILIRTEADRNDHWVELYKADTIPSFQKYQRVFCIYFICETGEINISSVIDNKATISSDLISGGYSVYVAAVNLGVDLQSLKEDSDLTDEEYKERYDLERYDVFIVAGKPSEEGRIHDVM